MSDSEKTLWCDGCGAEILWGPYLANRKEYCCQDCSLGIKCRCAEYQEWDSEYREAVLSVANIEFSE